MRRYNKLLSVAVATAMGLSVNVSAQDSDEVVEEVTVTGIRGSLKRSADMKREATGVLDAISAEDIGKFPDTNLAESLQRISGVSIDRRNGEGSRVTVRGFGPDFNFVTLNGRKMPTANIESFGASSSRSFDFAQLASESVSAVEVYKTGRAALPTGGIGSTINIVTNKPLDNNEPIASVGAKATFDSSVRDYSPGSEITPEISGIYSNTFADDTIGIGFTGSYSERDNGVSVAGVGQWYTIAGGTGDWGSIPADATNWENPPQAGDVYATPRNFAYDFINVQRKRTNGQLTLQYAPRENVTSTLDYTYSKFDAETQQNSIGAWFNGNPAGGIFSTGGTGPSVVAPILFTDSSGTDLTFAVGDWGTVQETQSLGFNTEWFVSDRLNLELDYHTSNATNGAKDLDRGTGNVLTPVQFDRNFNTVDFRPAVPVFNVGFGNGATGIDPSRISSSGSAIRNGFMETDVDQLQVEGSFELDPQWINNGSANEISIDFGIEHIETKARGAFSNAQRDSWGGFGSAADFDDSLFTLRSLPAEFDDLSASSGAIANYVTVDFREFVAAIAAVDPNVPVSGSTPCGPVLCANPVFSTDRTTTEEQQSVYGQLNINFDIGNQPVNLAVGARYEQTDVTSSGVVPGYERIQWNGGNEFTAVATGDSTVTVETGKYSNFLPNIDFDIELSENVVMRSSYSKTLTRPGLGDLQGGTTIGQIVRLTGGSGSVGNADLDPFESTNFDFSTEWYYDDESYISAGYYSKDVENFIANSNRESTFADLAHPGLGPRYDAAVASGGDIFQYFVDNGFVNSDGFVVGDASLGDPLATFNLSIPVNEKEASINGFEIAAQHIFGDTGFGAIANYTTVNGDIEYNNLEVGFEPQFALTGLSDSYNIVGFYEKNKIQARIAYNWRDDFYNGQGFADGGRFYPIYVKDYGQFDISASYEFNEAVSVFFDGINVTDEKGNAYSRSEDLKVNTVQTGPRYHIGVRYKFYQ